MSIEIHHLYVVLVGAIAKLLSLVSGVMGSFPTRRVLYDLHNHFFSGCIFLTTVCPYNTRNSRQDKIILSYRKDSVGIFNNKEKVRRSHNGPVRSSVHMYSSLANVKSLEHACITICTAEHMRNDYYSYEFDIRSYNGTGLTVGH